MNETNVSENIKDSAWTPLKRPLFRDRWLASLVSNTGSWMQDTAATWLMTSLTPSPLMIALMQTAASLPVLLFGLLAGAMADILDRRKLLLFWQSWMLAAAVLLSVLSFAGAIGPWMLLTLTLLLSIGAALNNPAWQAIVPELVPRAELPEAISLNSAGYNLARALGPALGGLGIAIFSRVTVGAGVVFLFNALSFMFVIFVLYVWKRQPLHTTELPAERLVSSIRAGLRYVHYANEIKAVLVRAFLMTSCVSAMWALLAVVAQRDLKHGSLGYGLLNACIGIGAVIGAIMLPKVRARFAVDVIVAAAAITFAITLTVMAFVPQTAILILVLLAAGFAWTSTTSTFNIAVQVSVPSWVQARALGTYQMVFQAGMALGSAFWGTVAEHASTSIALSAAALGLLAGLPAARRYRINTGGKANLASAKASGLTRSDPAAVIDLHPEDGPVRITIDYEIDPLETEQFIEAIDALKQIRLRDGAMRWGLFHDTQRPTLYVESFIVESWAEYLRQRERFTVEDLSIREKVLQFHRGEHLPTVSRMLYTPTSPRRRRHI
jgi:MFS family permease